MTLPMPRFVIRRPLTETFFPSICSKFFLISALLLVNSNFVCAKGFCPSC